MKFIYNLEKKLGKYAIRDLSLVITICFAASYLLNLLLPSVYELLLFMPDRIFINHEIWRIFTWIFTTPGKVDFWVFIMLFFYFSIGRTIENRIGTFYFNLYIFGNLLLTTVAQLLSWGFVFFTNSREEFMAQVLASYLYEYGGGLTMTYFLTISIFLCFALISSDAMVLLFFIIPFKVSWLAYIDAFFLLYYFISFPVIGIRATIIALAVNFAWFYMMMRKATKRRKIKISAEQLKRRRAYQEQMNKAKENQSSSVITRHKCAVCGRTERDGDDLEFRFCSKCKGNYEYCQEHLFTHEHVK